jgi:hypothetical protein
MKHIVNKSDRNTIIVSALAHYYDYNNLSKEEGREVIRIIMDIRKSTRMINPQAKELHDIQVMLETLVCWDNQDLQAIKDGVMVAIKEIINIKNK